MGRFSYLNPLNILKDLVNVIDENNGHRHTFPDPYNQGHRQTYQAKQAPPQYQQYQWQPPTVEEQWPGHWFHGTNSHENAVDIMTTQTWWVQADHGNPAGIYVGKEFKLAQSYSGNQGAIIVVYINPGIVVEQLGTTDHYYVPVPEKHAYFAVEGVVPVACLDVEGNRVM